MDIVEILKSISMTAGYIITIITCLLLFIRPVRAKIIDSVNKTIKKCQEDEELKQVVYEISENLTKHIECGELQNEALLAILRDHITETYYKLKDKKEIHAYKRESLVKEYAIYHRLNGNSYVDVIYDEIIDDWKVI